MALQTSESLLRVARSNHGLLIERNGKYRLARNEFTWLNLVCAPSTHERTIQAYETGTTVPCGYIPRMLNECDAGLIDLANTVVCAFGVTFLKSEVARDDEFKSGGNVAASGSAVASAARQPDTPYTRVGPAGNPAELFLKGVRPHHLFKSGQAAGIRSIETLPALIEGNVVEMPPWNVHEAEVATMVNPLGQPVAFGPAKDMSDRRDEGISPLLLLKAKIFWHGAGFGNWFTVPENPLAFWKTISLRSWVERDGKKVWPIPSEPDTMSTLQCRRPLEELCQDVDDAGFVGENQPAVFMSGTGIVPAPGDTFSLLPNDRIFYESDQIGDCNSTVQLIPRPRRRLVVTA